MSNILLFASRTCAGSLLSPPSSPQMSRRALEFDETNFEAAWMASEQNSSAFAENRNSRSVDSLDSHKQPPCASGRPILGLHEGFFSSTRSTGNMKEESSEPANQSTISSTIEGWRPSSDVIGLVKADAKNGLPGSKLNRLGPDSFPRFIPDTAFTNPEDELDYDEEYAMTASDQDEHMNEGGVSKTTSEEPVNKRKMKRFRLAHILELVLD